MTAIDEFKNTGADRGEPVTGGADLGNGDDSAELDFVSRALWVGTAGNLKVTMMDGTILTFTNITIGWHPLRVRKVFDTGSTADGIIAVW